MKQKLASLFNVFCKGIITTTEYDNRLCELAAQFVNGNSGDITKEKLEFALTLLEVMDNTPVVNKLKSL